MSNDIKTGKLTIRCFASQDDVVDDGVFNLGDLAPYEFKADYIQESRDVVPTTSSGVELLHDTAEVANSASNGLKLILVQNDGDYDFDVVMVYYYSATPITETYIVKAGEYFMATVLASITAPTKTPSICLVDTRATAVVAAAPGSARVLIAGVR